jgi:hypothetical protein
METTALDAGLALQETRANFAAGVMLLTFRPIRLGDAVDISGATSKGVEIGVAIDTILLGEDDRLVTDPEPLIAVMEMGGSVREPRRPAVVRRRPLLATPLRSDGRAQGATQAAGCSIPYPQADARAPEAICSTGSASPAS